MTKAEWHESSSTWTVEFANNSIHECDVLINAGGILNNPNSPRLKNLDTFQGQKLHSAAWGTTADLTGKHIAIIGAGASAIQLLLAVQAQVAHADLYIRTPS